MTLRAWNTRHDELNVTFGEAASRLDFRELRAALGFIGADDNDAARPQAKRELDPSF